MYILKNNSFYKAKQLRQNMVEKGDDNQNSIRGEGILMPICVHADCLAEADHKAIIACHDLGARCETPKHRPGMTLGYDDPIIIGIRHADTEPKVYYPGFHDSGLGAMQYLLEVTHGIHNHWKKNAEHPEWWGYTYNERFVDQLPFVFQRIKNDWDERKEKEGKGRITGREYQFDIWRAGEDIVLEQPDAPCFQRGVIRFLKNNKGQIVMNYITSWRSRDEFKALDQNIIGQIGSKKAPGLMRLIRDKVAAMIGEPIEMGSYIDYSDSLHLYGLYIDRDNLEHQIEQMKRDGWEKKTMALDDYLIQNDEGLDITGLKRFLAAQSDAEVKGHGLNQPKAKLIELGYDIDNFQYPADWDSWPRSWDAQPDPRKIARVLGRDDIKRVVMEELCETGFASVAEAYKKIREAK